MIVKGKRIMLLGMISFSVFVMALWLTPSSMGQTKVVKIGNILPLSGGSATGGIESRGARELAVEEINSAGGVKSLGGAKFEMVYADSEGKPEKGVAEAERLINTEKVVLLEGCWNSAVTYPTTAVAERYGIPMIVSTSVADKITEAGFKTVFRITAKSSWWSRDQFVFLRDMQKEFNVKLNTLGLVHENGDWGMGCAAKWKELAASDGYQVVLDEPYPDTATDLSPVVQKIRRAQPDVLLLASNAADAILLTNTMADYKVKPKAIVTSSGGHTDPSFMATTGKNCRYYFDVTEFEPDINIPGAKKANAIYRTKFGRDLNSDAFDSYLAMYVIKDVLERAASVEPAKILKALRETNYGGPGTILDFDKVQFGPDGQNKNAHLLVVQNDDLGKGMERITVWPKTARRTGYKPVFPMP